MRVACLVIVGYLMAVIVSAVWPLLPFPISFARLYTPCMAALAATYLGFSSRDGVVVAALASAVAGYLIDIVSGGATALSCTPAVVVSLACVLIHARITMRKPWWIGGVCAAMVVLFYVAQGAMLAVLGAGVHGATHSWSNIVVIALLSGLIAPAAFALFRRVDAALSRTVRDREAVLEGRL